MKRLGGLIGGMLLLSLAWMTVDAPKATAACSNTSSFGAVKLLLPDLSANQDYFLWLRMQSAEPQAKVLVELNRANCLEVTASVPETKQWFWQVYQINGTTQPLRFEQTVGNSLRIIGIQSGLKLDKVLLAEPGCTPQDFGSNCKNAIEAAGVNDIGVTMIQPLTDDMVSGKVTLSNTPSLLQGQLSRLDYVVGGRTIQSFTSAESFDTTLVANGKYTVSIEMTLIDGTLIREATVIEVNNIENILSPTIRWARLNMRPLMLTGLAVTGTIILLLLIGGLRRWLLKRRQMHFHGF